MDLPNFKTCIIGVQVAQVHSIAVALARAVHEFAIVVNGTAPFDDFVKAVAIHIARRNVVIALSIAFLTACSCVVVPTLRKRLSIPIVSGNRHAGVVTTLKHHARLFSVKVGICRQESIHAVAVTIAPALDRAASGVIIHRRHFLAGLAVENREPLRSRENVSVGVSIILAVVSTLRRTERQVTTATIFCAGSRLHGKFRLTVAIVVTHKHLRIMSPRTNVHTKVNAPKFLATHLVAINEHVAGLALLRVVLGIARIPLENQLKFTVTIHIAYRNIVGAIGIVATAIRPVKIHSQKLVIPHRDRCICCLFLATDNGLHGVLTCGSSLRVGIVARLRTGKTCDFLAVTIQIKARCLAIGSENAPAEEHTPARLNGN